MSSTERARRRRARLAAERKQAPGPQRATPTPRHTANAGNTAKDQRIAELEARIAELEHERDRYKQTAESGGKDFIAELENAVRRAKQRVWEAERRAKSKAQREAKSAALRKAATDRKAKRVAAKAAR